MKPLHLRADPIPLSGTLLSPLTFIVLATSVLTGFLCPPAHTHICLQAHLVRLPRGYAGSRLEGDAAVVFTRVILKGHSCFFESLPRRVCHFLSRHERE